MQMPDTPELDKAQPLYEKMRELMDFLDYINSEFDLHVCEEIYDCDEECTGLFPVGRGRLIKLVHEFYELDEDKMEDERRALLAYQQHLYEREA